MRSICQTHIRTSKQLEINARLIEDQGMYIYIYIISLQVRRSSLTMSLAKDQGLRGPLVYLSLIELSPYSPHVHRCQAFSTLEIFRGHCAAPPVLWHQSHK